MEWLHVPTAAIQFRIGGDLRLRSQRSIGPDDGPLCGRLAGGYACLRVGLERALHDSLGILSILSILSRCRLGLIRLDSSRQAVNRGSSD